MAQLKTDYKDEILDTSVNTQRKYRQVDNGDGTISLVDETEYTQQGDTFGAGDINAITGNLTAENGESFNFAYNSETGEYGYMAKVEGADTFRPFSSGANIGTFAKYALGATSGAWMCIAANKDQTYSHLYGSNSSQSQTIDGVVKADYNSVVALADGFKYKKSSNADWVELAKNSSVSLGVNETMIFTWK